MNIQHIINFSLITFIIVLQIQISMIYKVFEGSQNNIDGLLCLIETDHGSKDRPACDRFKENGL